MIQLLDFENERELKSTQKADTQGRKVKKLSIKHFAQKKHVYNNCFFSVVVVVVVKGLNYLLRGTKVAEQNVHKMDVMEQIKQKRINLKFMLYSCCIYSGSSKSMNFYSQIFGLSVSLNFFLCQIWKLIALKTRKVLVLGHLLRHSLLFRS